MPQTLPVRPPFDPELVPAVEAFRQTVPDFTPETLPRLRELMAGGTPGAEPVDLTAGGRVRVDELTVPGQQGAPDIALTVLRPAAGTGPWPLIYHTHGGGMVVGNRYSNLDMFLPHVLESGAVVASVEYRLAPENPDPAPVEDCYAGLVWLARNSAAVDADPARIILAGASAGGGLAAGTALLARDRGFPHVTHQVLICPMLDDRLQTPSSQMLDQEGIWDRNNNAFGWSALLGYRRGTDDVSPYAAPARASDLGGLPRTYLDVGSVESFRDEVIDYATRLSQAGVVVDLHLWGGGFHGFDLLMPQTALSRAALATRDDFIRRALER